MEMSYVLVQQQVQKLVMTQVEAGYTPASALTADLVEYVRNELLQNPVLEEEQAETARESWKRLIQEVQTSNPILAAMTMT